MPNASIPSAGGQAGPTDEARARAFADTSQVTYDHDRHVFEMTIDGKPTRISPLAAVALVTQNRYLALADRTAEQTRQMQDQVNQINEVNRWISAAQDAQKSGTAFTAPSGSRSSELSKWLSDNDIHPSEVGSDVNELSSLETKLSNYVDQLSSTNDLKMLQLKTSVNKSQEMLTLSSAVLQTDKQLWQTIAGDIAR